MCRLISLPQTSGVEVATWNERAGIAGPSLIGFPPPNRLGEHGGTGTDCWTNAKCNAECYTPGARVQCKNDGGISRDCGSDDDWKWKQEEAGGQEGCIGDDCNASCTCPPHNLVTGLHARAWASQNSLVHDLGSTMVHPFLLHCRERVGDLPVCTGHLELVQWARQNCTGHLVETCCEHPAK